MNFQSKVALVLLLTSIPAGLFVFATPVSRSEHSQLTESKAPASQTSMRIAREVQHQLLLLSNYGIFDWLECGISPDRSASLRGQVTRPTLKSDAESALRRIEDIRRINNQIEVLPISPGDDQIRIAVYRSVFRYESPLFRYATLTSSPIHLIVNNGSVTLKGVVDNATDSQLAYMAARSVSGVFDVKNELRVSRRS